MSNNPKHAAGCSKPPQHFIPLCVMIEVGIGMAEGGWNYGSFNFRTSEIVASVYYDATRRHLDAWWEGEDIDPKSGLNHITKAITSLVVLRDSMMQAEYGARQDLYIDDRPPKSAVTMEHMTSLYQTVMSRVKEINPESKKPFTEIGLAT